MSDISIILHRIARDALYHEEQGTHARTVSPIEAEMDHEETDRSEDRSGRHSWPGWWSRLTRVARGVLRRMKFQSRPVRGCTACHVSVRVSVS